MHPICFVLAFDITSAELVDPKYQGPFQEGDHLAQCHLVRIQHIDNYFCTLRAYHDARMVEDHRTYLILEVVCDLRYLFFIFGQQNFLPLFAIRGGIGSYQYSIILALAVSSCYPFYLKVRIYSQAFACIGYRPWDFLHLFSKDLAKGVLQLLRFYPFEESSKCIHLPYFEDPSKSVKIET